MSVRRSTRAVFVEDVRRRMKRGSGRQRRRKSEGDRVRIRKRGLTGKVLWVGRLGRD